jgi:hypothetical protein
MTYADFEEACKYWKGVAAARLKEIERLENLLANADLCAVCGLDYAGYADYEYACKCDEVIK